MNKISKKYKIRKIKKTNLNKNKKKTKKIIISKFYNLSGGGREVAFKLFTSHFDKIQPYLTHEEMISKKPTDIINTISIKGKTYSNPEHITMFYDNIIDTLTQLTYDFFERNDIIKDYDTYEGDELTTFCNKFIDDNIEWIIKCYVNADFYLTPNTSVNTTSVIKDNLLFQNYNTFLELYTQLTFIFKNSDHIHNDIKYNISHSPEKKQSLQQIWLEITTKKKPNHKGLLFNFANLIELYDFISKNEHYLNTIKIVIDNIKQKAIGYGPLNVKIIEDTPNLYIYEILTFPGSLYYGSNTIWCTATTTANNLYLKYSKDLYIIQAKDKDTKTETENTQDPYKLQKSNDKYQIQLSISTEMFKDNKDQDITFNEVIKHFNNDEKLINFFKTKCEKNIKTNNIYKYNYDNTELTLENTSLCRTLISNVSVYIDNKNIKKLDLRYLNKPLGDLLNGLDKLEDLTIGGKLNQPLGDSLNSLEKLQMLSIGGNFNQPLGDSLNGLDKLQELKFLTNFNQPLDNSLNGLDNLATLEIRGEFNKPLGDSLNSLIKLKKLTISGKFNQSLDNSLNGLDNLATLEIRGKFNKPLGNSLNYLTNLETFTISGEFNHPLDNSLNYLKKLKTFTIEGEFNQSLGNSLNDLTNLETFTIGGEFNQSLGKSLNGLTKLKTLFLAPQRYDKFNQPLGDSLNDLINLISLLIFGDFTQPVDNSLDSLQNLENLTIYTLSPKDKLHLNTILRKLKYKLE